MKEILDIIHKTIYQFFDVCGDNEEVPMSDKDKLLLEVNKAICNNLKALDPQPKTGHWIKYGKLYQCSECKELSCCQGKFCNECGMKMVEPQESEDKE